MTKTVVLGAGPAGAACGLWLHQLGCPVTVLERAEQAGGLQRLSPCENRWLPSVMGIEGRDIAARLHTQLLDSGVDLRVCQTVERVETVAGQGFLVWLAEGPPVRADRLVLATGTRFRHGGFINDGAVAVGPGQSIEAIDVRGRHVAVLGGGDNAFDQYGFLRARGAASVTVFARTVRAQTLLREAVPAGDVVVGPFVADAGSMTVNGRRYDVFSVQFGFEPVVPEGLSGLARRPDGAVVADLWGQTSGDGVYAAGDVSNTFHPCVVTSFAHGVQVAKHIHAGLEKRVSPLRRWPTPAG